MVKTKQFVSINRKVILAVVLASTLITALLTLVNLYVDFRNEKQVQNLALRQIENVSLKSITEATWNIDDVQIKKNVDGIFEINDVISIYIEDEKENVILSRKKKVAPNIQSYSFYQNFNLVYDGVEKKYNLGVIKIEVTNYYLYQRMFQKLIVFFFTQGIKTFIISFVMFTIFNFYVTKHILAMVTHFSNQLAGSDVLLEKLEFRNRDVDKYDELDVLADTYNELAKTVNNRYYKEKNDFELILNSAGEGIIMLDQNDRISYINVSGANLLGANVDELAGLSVDEFVLIEKDLNLDVGHYIVVQSKGKEGDLYFQKRNGEVFPVEVTGTQLKGYGDEAGIVLVFKDITKQKEIQAQLIRSKEVAEDAFETKARFVANMSHEIRTPMNGIVGFSELILQSDISDENKEHALMIKECSQELLKIVNDILDFSKIEDGKLELEISRFDIRQWTKNTLALFKTMVDEKGIKLTANIEDKIPEIIATDALRLKQVLINLVSNAIKFTEHGGVEVFIETVSGRDDYIMFKVKDSGIGIDEATKEKIFSRFTQADSSTTRKFGGTGLGLAISKNLVKALGGSIAVESDGKNGSTFYFSVELKNS